MSNEPLDEKQKKLIKMLKDNNINTNMSQRAEEETPHNPKSEQLMSQVVDVDWLLMGDQFGWKSGDEEKGEAMMYVFDVIFDLQDKLSAETVPEKALDINHHWYYIVENLSRNNEDPFVYFVRKKHWDSEGTVEEDILEAVEKEQIIIPYGFVEVMDAAYGPYSQWSIEETVAIVKKWGFDEAPAD
jgi:hypothetical protein